MNGKPWTDAEVADLVRMYPDAPMQSMRAHFGCSEGRIYAKAGKLCLKRSEAYLASPDACRLRREDAPGRAYRYPKGHVPANKGLRRPGYAPGRMASTQFKKGGRTGRANLIYRPIGTERLSKEGYLERKIHDRMPLQSRWRGVHLLLWESQNGPIPKGHALWFRNRDKTDIRIENLELVTRGELMLRNTIHNLPRPLVDVLMLKGRVMRQIHKRERGQREKQD